jgi:hypothetical protein
VQPCKDQPTCIQGQRHMQAVYGRQSSSGRAGKLRTGPESRMHIWHAKSPEGCGLQELCTGWAGCMCVGGLCLCCSITARDHSSRRIALMPCLNLCTSIS